MDTDAQHRDERPLVLVVDDDEPIRHLVSVVLRDIARVVDAASGAEAIDVLAGEPAALVILDARLPDGEGMDIARRMRALPSWGRTPIVMVSGDPASRLPSSGVDAYLRKPFDIEELRRCVRGFLAPTGDPQRR